MSVLFKSSRTCWPRSATELERNKPQIPITTVIISRDVKESDHRNAGNVGGLGTTWPVCVLGVVGFWPISPCIPAARWSEPFVAWACTLLCLLKWVWVLGVLCRSLLGRGGRRQRQTSVWNKESYKETGDNWELLNRCEKELTFSRSQRDKQINKGNVRNITPKIMLHYFHSSPSNFKSILVSVVSWYAVCVFLVGWGAMVVFTNLLKRTKEWKQNDRKLSVLPLAS